MTPTTDVARPRASPGLDVTRIREDFPILTQEIHGSPLVYFDNAATTQRPRAVLDAIRVFYERDNANINRGVHELSRRSTALPNFQRCWAGFPT